MPTVKFKKGDKKRGGRKAGVPNKLTKTVREAFEAAFHEMQRGGSPVTLEKWAKKNPTEFYKLAAKLIPQEINANVNVDLAKRIAEARERAGGGD